MYISTELWLFVSVCVRVCERNKLVSSEVTNRDDYLSEELSSEEDIPEENIVEVQSILIDHGPILFLLIQFVLLSMARTRMSLE